MKYLGILSALLVLSTTILLNHEQSLNPRFTLQFDFAANQNFPLQASRFSVTWNSKPVEIALPDNYRVHRVRLTLVAKVGTNSLNFRSNGKSTGVGVTIDNVQLYRRKSKGYEDLISNGGFEQGHKIGKGEKIFNSKFGWWVGKQIKIGYGQKYNKFWIAGTHVLVLDSPTSNVYQ